MDAELTKTDLIIQYIQRTKKKKLVLLLLACLTVLLAIISLCTGASKLSFLQTLQALFGRGDSFSKTVVWQIRMPRVLTALVAGIGLAAAGCVLQNVLKNPMASPSTLGVSNAAVFGANFAIIALQAGAFHSTHGNTLTVSNPYLVTLCAFLCAFGATFAVLALSSRRGFSAETVVLAGLAIGTVFSAGTTILQYVSMDTQVAASVFWTFGDLGRAAYKEVATIAIVTGISLAYFIPNAWNFNALNGGEGTAISLGVNVKPVRFVSLFLASVTCAVCVSFLGIIGFIGLIAPAAVKRIIGADYRYMLPASALTGAALLLLSDILGRSVLKGVTLPVGAITALYGGPAFLWLLFTGKRAKSGVRI